MSTSYQKLLKNTFILSIGSIGSKILAFIIVPLYTYVLSTEEYGKIDLFMTGISFCLPFINLLIQEAIIRFLLGKEITKETAASNAALVYFVGLIISIVFLPIFYLIFNRLDYTLLYIILLNLNSFTVIYSQYLRAIGDNISYTINGLLSTFSFLMLNLFFLLYAKMGIIGYLLASILSQGICCIYIIFKANLKKVVSLKYINIHYLLRMLRYSIPLIPNSLFWWIMSAGDKFIINFYLGDSYNGIYSIALKLPTIITIFFSIFFQAWQLSSIEENDSENRYEFYSTVYKMISGLLLIVSSGIFLFDKFIFYTIIDVNFISAWKYVPLLCLASIISCLNSFFSVVYTITKNTKKVFISTALGAVFNLGFNFILIPNLGLQGVALGTCIGYLIVLFIRIYDMKKYISLDYDSKRVSISYFILLVQIMLLLTIKTKYVYIFQLICFCIILILYRFEIIQVLHIIKYHFVYRKKH